MRRVVGAEPSRHRHRLAERAHRGRESRILAECTLPPIRFASIDRLSSAFAACFAALRRWQGKCPPPHERPVVAVAAAAGRRRSQWSPRSPPAGCAVGVAMSSYQIKNGVGHRNFVELRHRRNNEAKRKFDEKKKMKKMINRASEGGQNPLDAGRRMLGSVRVWAMTLDDEYFSHPSPPNAIVILDGQEDDGDEQRHCCLRWRNIARTLLGEQLDPAPPKVEESDGAEHIPGSADAGAAAVWELEPEPEPEPRSDSGGEEEEEEGEEEDWEEDQEPYAVFVVDYTAVASELAGESSQFGLGPAAKPIARALLKIAGDGMRLVACGPAALLVSKVMQQPQVAERVAQVVLVRPEMPGGTSRTWLKPADKPSNTPVLVFGGGEGGLVYEAQRDGWVTGANARPKVRCSARAHSCTPSCTLMPKAGPCL